MGNIDLSYSKTIFLVKDIEFSKGFYRDLLGQEIEEDFGNYVVFKGGLAMHCAEGLINTIYKSSLRNYATSQGSQNLMIAFVSNSLDEIYERLKRAGIPFIHPVERQPWGQRVLRFYDPDEHLVEIGEVYP